MFTLHPEFVTRERNKKFVVLPYEEFTALQELIRKYEAESEFTVQPSLIFDNVERDLGL